MDTIESQRTRLRRFEKDDIADVHSFLGNPEVMRFSLNGAYSREECHAFLSYCEKTYNENGYGLFAVTLKKKKPVIGYCGFYDQQIDGHAEVEIGYRLHPSYWNQGIATEAARAVQNYGFEKLGFTRLISIIEKENLASIRVAEKNGMIHEKDTLFKGTTPVRIYSIESLRIENKVHQRK